MGNGISQGVLHHSNYNTPNLGSHFNPHHLNNPANTLNTTQHLNFDHHHPSHHRFQIGQNQDFTNYSSRKDDENNENDDNEDLDDEDDEDDDLMENNKLDNYSEDNNEIRVKSRQSRSTSESRSISPSRSINNDHSESGKTFKSSAHNPSKRQKIEPISPKSIGLFKPSNGASLLQQIPSTSMPASIPHQQTQAAIGSHFNPFAFHSMAHSNISSPSSNMIWPFSILPPLQPPKPAKTKKCDISNIESLIESRQDDLPKYRPDSSVEISSSFESSNSSSCNNSPFKPLNEIGPDLTNQNIPPQLLWYLYALQQQQQQNSINLRDLTSLNKTVIKNEASTTPPVSPKLAYKKNFTKSSSKSLNESMQSSCGDEADLEKFSDDNENIKIETEEQLIKSNDDYVSISNDCKDNKNNISLNCSSQETNPSSSSLLSPTTGLNDDSTSSSHSSSSTTSSKSSLNRFKKVN